MFHLQVSLKSPPTQTLQGPLCTLRMKPPLLSRSYRGPHRVSKKLKIHQMLLCNLSDEFANIVGDDDGIVSSFGRKTCDDLINCLAFFHSCPDVATRCIERYDLVG